MHDLRAQGSTKLHLKQKAHTHTHTLGRDGRLDEDDFRKSGYKNTSEYIVYCVARADKTRHSNLAVDGASPGQRIILLALDRIVQKHKDAVCRAWL